MFEIVKALKKDGKISEAIYRDFYRRAWKFYLFAVQHLLKKLPLKSTVLKQMRFLHPEKKTDESCVSDIKGVAIAMVVIVLLIYHYFNVDLRCALSLWFCMT